jgi:sRNA-binding carbon storage regulator CsrA
MFNNNAANTVRHQRIQAEHKAASRREAELEAKLEAKHEEERLALAREALDECKAQSESLTSDVKTLSSLVQELNSREIELSKKLYVLESLLSSQQDAVRIGIDAATTGDVSRTEEFTVANKQELDQTIYEKKEKSVALSDAKTRLSALQNQLPELQFEAMTRAEQKVELKRRTDAERLAAKIATLKKFPKGTIMDKECKWFGWVKHPDHRCISCADAAPCGMCGRICCFWRIYGRDRICHDCEMKEYNSGRRRKLIYRP